LPQKVKKRFDGKLYKRYNAYATREKAHAIALKLKDGITKDGFQTWYDRTRITKNDKLKYRKFILWVNGKHGDRPIKGSKGKIKKGKKPRKIPSTYTPRIEDNERTERVKSRKSYLYSDWW